MVPAEVEKVTDFEKLPLPVTVGVQVVVPPPARDVAWQARETAVIEEDWLREMTAVPDLVGS